MIHQEKKFRVDSLEPIGRLLTAKGIQPGPRIVSTHYYVPQTGNDVVKLVVYSDRSEIHELKEQKGTFVFHEPIPVKDKEAGFVWLKKRGYKSVDVVKMEYTEYPYKNGTVGLYTIDGFLHSVILYYPEGKHWEIAEEFELANAEPISVPYDKLLASFGRLRSMKLVN